jgi:hypothetical protein
VLNGKDQNGRQRFKCRGCQRTYNILTGTPMARARKPEKWGKYLRGMTEHVSVRALRGSGIGVSHVTVWRWRHRFLQAAANDNAARLSGVIEADTMFFPRSFKGSRRPGNERSAGVQAARSRTERGSRSRARREKVPVLTAIDSNDNLFEQILASLSEIDLVLHSRIAAGSVLWSPGNAAYVSAAARAGAEHRAAAVPGASPQVATIVGPAAQRPPERSSLARVKGHHRRLNYLVNERCRGVATKYLRNYLGWNRAMARPGFEGRTLLDRALA